MGRDNTIPVCPPDDLIPIRQRQDPTHTQATSRRAIRLGLLFLLAAVAALAHPHRYCFPDGKTGVIEGDSKFARYLEKNPTAREIGLEEECPTPEPSQEEPEPPKAPPEVLPTPPPPQARSIPIPGPYYCMVFHDIREGDRAVITNITNEDMDCLLTQYADGKEAGDGEFKVGAYKKVRYGPPLGFDGWWRLSCTKPWRGSRARSETFGQSEMEASPCRDSCSGF